MKSKLMKKEMTRHCVVTAFRYGTGESYAIICSDRLQASMIFGRACAAGNMYGTPNQCSFSDNQEMTRFARDVDNFDGIRLSMRSLFLMGDYNHDITDEELDAMTQFVAAAFPDEDNEQEKTTEYSARTAISTKFKDNRVSNIEKIRL